MLLKRVVFIGIIISSTLFANSYPGQILYIHPTPNSIDVRPQSSIIIKVDYAPNSILTKSEFVFDIKGSKSGSVTGDVKVVRNTIVFRPNEEFNTGEIVNVNFASREAGVDNLSFSFQTSDILKFDTEISQPHIEKLRTPEKTDSHDGEIKIQADPTVINGVAVPADFPVLQPFVNLDGTAPGRLFFSVMQDANPYIMILENNGTPYFYRRVERRTRDFKLQPTGHLSRMVTPSSGLSDGWEVLDSNYNSMGVYAAKNGYSTDDHEFVMTKVGTYLIIAADYRTIDGRNLRGNHVQEVDIATGEVVFQWLSWDHLDYQDAPHGNDSNRDYIHMNSIAVDYDSNLVMSLRNQDQCIKIDRVTGDIIWRLGGVKNQFNFINDQYKLAYQHHFQPVPGKPDHYTVFDNGEYRIPNFSRGVEFKLDTDNMTAEKVWELRTNPDRFSHWMGSVQRLSNGNTLVNWADASQPKPTEATSEGEIVYDADFNIPSNIYRAFRFEWEAQLNEPYLIVEPGTNNIRLIYNKFGDTTVVSYNIYADPFDNPTSLIANSTETWYDVNPAYLTNQTYYYFRVTAVNDLGEESPYSNTEIAFVNFVKPGNSSAQLGTTRFRDADDPRWVEEQGVFGFALDYDGINDFVNCGNDPSLQISGTEITLEARVKATSWKNSVWQGSVLVKDESTQENYDEGYMIRIGANGTVNFNLGAEGPDDKWHELNTAQNTLSLNEWYHIAATYDGVTMKIYVNGEEKASRNESLIIGDARGRPLHIGSSPHFPGRYFDGLIDEVRVWNIARSQNEIQSTMEIQLGSSYYTDENSGLVGYWQFNEGMGQISADLAKSDNLIINGNFDDSDDFWNFSKSANVQTEVNIDDHYYVNITDGGSTQSDIIISQNNISLDQGDKYILNFDAWAQDDKFIDVKIRKVTSPFTDYTKIGAVYVNSTEKSYHLQF